ncbi:MAG: winged helix-turn-helix domain-containing protein [Pirellulales bacterium]|nr:winged helix-turn-helix domain-containing protein [Pirellulales bacterium]
MATDIVEGAVQQIGETSGTVWRTLADHGPLSFNKLIKEVGAPRDLVMQALGWLAREDKVAIEETSRGRVVALKYPG